MRWWQVAHPADPWALSGPAHRQLQAATKALDLNTATYAQLVTLPCVGPVRARRILRQRIKGWYARVDALWLVPGLDSCRSLLTGRVQVHPDTLAALQALAQAPLPPGPRLNLNMADAQALQGRLSRQQIARLLALRDSLGRVTDWALLAQHTGWDARTLYSLSRQGYWGQRLAVVDLNRADSTALEALPGIGAKLAGRIPRYRAALGFFTSPEQLLEVYGLQPKHYASVRPYVVVGPPPPGAPRIAINTVSPAQLRKHPYFRDRAQVDRLLHWRAEQGRIANAAHWLRAPLPPDWLARTAPYVAYE